MSNYSYHWDQYKGHSSSVGHIMRSTASEYRRKHLPSPILREFLERQDYTKAPNVKIPPAERCLPFLPASANLANHNSQQSNIVSREKPCCQSCSDGGQCAGK
ncbi:DgyrCDS10647 [Dimorphilus gyrociliatus]|uniref:DgyrCDS10647 n=1 Tax=Dimorphilus gyrociliatus TaxID=2664684 RepID=A0A7I8W0X6_9ANNE|nr:DgyrCDS10647 [Dimorphilus gyrociliatus]